jgi:hypothetical protein
LGVFNNALLLDYKYDWGMFEDFGCGGWLGMCVYLLWDWACFG